MKNKAKTQQSQNKLSQSAKPALSEEELDDIISDITLKRGRNAYTIYITEMYQKEKAQNDKIKLMDVSKKYSSKWAKVSDKDKDTYEKKSQEEKEKFKKDLETVKHYLFSYIKEGATAYRVFLDKRLSEAFEKDEDPKDAKAKASKEWAAMSNEEKQEWKALKKENDHGGKRQSTQRL